MLNDAQVERYLARIGWAENVALCQESLDQLAFAHQCAVPFETVTMRRAGKTPALDTKSLYDKVVARHLGGYCFELNKLFEELLRALGFEASPRLARAVCGEKRRMPINHRGTVVMVDGRPYLVDVGFGGPMPAGALLLEDGLEQVVRGETFTPVRMEDSWWRIERITWARDDFSNGDVPVRRQNELEVCEAACEDADFASLNMFAARPGSEFRDNDLVNMRTETGYRALTNRKLTLKDGEEKRIIQLESDQDFREALAIYFGMAY